MENVTFSANEHLIRAARERAQASGTTLDEEFRRWLAAYVGRDELARRTMETIEELSGRVRTWGRKFTRDEMNER